MVDAPRARSSVRRVAWLLGGAVLVMMSVMTFLQSSEPLEVGDHAPDFGLPGSDGRTYRLADFSGKQAVVLAWFPKAFTGG
jgi:peroxiredoxin Q/BCP